MPTKTCPRLLRAAEVAERLGLSVKHVRRLMQDGELKATRLGPRAVRVSEPDLAAFVASRQHKGA